MYDMGHFQAPVEPVGTVLQGWLMFVMAVLDAIYYFLRACCIRPLCTKALMGPLKTLNPLQRR